MPKPRNAASGWRFPGRNEWPFLSRCARKPIPMNETLHKDFREFLQSLIERNVKFLVIGGYAVAWLGRPRNTDDLDIWVENSEENAHKVHDALVDFGFGGTALDPALFTRDHGIVRLGTPPWKIEIFVAIPGVTFSECYPRRIVWPVGEMEVPMICLADLRTNKLAAGRPKDFADLAHHLPETDEPSIGQADGH